MKCFNDLSQPVGPSNPNLSLAMFQTFALAPVSTFAPLDLSSSPNFTGRGWFYFSSADKFSVEVAWGLWPNTAVLSSGKVVGGNELELFRSGSSVGVGIAVGQSMVAGATGTVAVIPGVGNVPLWLGAFGGSRFDALILVNPTAVSGQVTVNVFDCAECSPMQAPTPVTVPLPGRGMGFVFLSTFGTVPFPEGNASINSGATCCPGLALGHQPGDSSGDLSRDHAGS